MAKILLIQTNAEDEPNLRIDREVKGINEVILKKSITDFNCISHLSPSLSELPSMLLAHKPEILHFSGHGSRSNLFFENAQGKAESVTGKTLSRLLANCADSIVCFCINACRSSGVAKEVQHLFPYTISFPGLINDDFSILFSKCFYELIAMGEDVEKSFINAKSVLSSYVKEADLPLIHVNSRHVRYTPSIYKHPSICAEFILNSKKKPKSSKELYHFSFDVRNLPSDASSIVYEFIDANFPDDFEPLRKIDHLGSGSKCREWFYGNVMVRAWIWLESRKSGVGIESSLSDAIRNNYKDSIPSECLAAFRTISEY
jgi:hypothetical protein